jgi:hypothetical protein
MVGTLGEMNVAGPSSRQARVGAAPTARSVVGWVVPGSRSRPLTAGGPVPAIARGGQLSGIGGYQSAASAPGAYRLWRTLAIAGRLSAVIWLLVMFGVLAFILDAQPTQDAFVGWLTILGLFFLLPAALLWYTAGRVVRGEPSWVRSIALIEMVVIVIATAGLAVVPLVLIFWVTGDEP